MSTPETCNWDAPEIDWLVGTDRWHTQCGRAFTFEQGGATSNCFKFCPFCGKELVDLEVHVHLRPGARKVEASHAN